jgi:hypothetical protein
LNSLVVMSWHTPWKCVRVLIGTTSIQLSEDNHDSLVKCTTSIECKTVITAVLMTMSVMDPHDHGRLRALLEHLGITTAPRYRIKEVPRLLRVEFKAIAENFFGSRILCRHKGPAFRTSCSDAVADAAWQAITSWVRSNKSRL